MQTTRYFIELSYDGGAYHGWQIQPNALTVQEVVTEAMQFQLGITGLQVTGCGRTDTGVHASQFFAHFDYPGEMENPELDDRVIKLNKQLPPDISIHRMCVVPEDAHARFSAISRTYRYYIHREKDPFLNDHSYYYYGPLDIDKMNAGAGTLLKFDDFTSFSKLHTQVRDNICQVSYAQWHTNGHRLIFTITADRFLRNMVRAVVGTLLDLGRNKITTDELEKIIKAKDRGLAGESIPAHGLFLEEVQYPPGLVPGPGF